MYSGSLITLEVPSGWRTLANLLQRKILERLPVLANHLGPC